MALVAAAIGLTTTLAVYRLVRDAEEREVNAVAREEQGWRIATGVEHRGISVTDDVPSAWSVERVDGGLRGSDCNAASRNPRAGLGTAREV